MSPAYDTYEPFPVDCKETVEPLPRPEPQRIGLRYEKDVPQEVADIIATVVNLPVWQFLILVEKFNDMIDNGLPK